MVAASCWLKIRLKIISGLLTTDLVSPLFDVFCSSRGSKAEPYLVPIRLVGFLYNTIEFKFHFLALFMLLPYLELVSVYFAHWSPFLTSVIVIIIAKEISIFCDELKRQIRSKWTDFKDSFRRHTYGNVVYQKVFIFIIEFPQEWRNKWGHFIPGKSASEKKIPSPEKCRPLWRKQEQNHALRILPSEQYSHNANV